MGQQIDGDGPCTLGCGQHLDDIELLPGVLLADDGDGDQTSLAVINRLYHYESTLRGLCGLFNACGDVTSEQWRSYVDGLNLQRNYPAVKNLMFVACEGSGATRDRGPWSITYRDPQTSRAGVKDFNAAASPEISSVLTYARDSDLSALSGGLHSAPLAASDNTCVFLSLPVYQQATLKGSLNVDDRRAACCGWVACTLDVHDLANDIIGKSVDRIDFRIYDGAELSTGNLLYDSNARAARSEATWLAQSVPFDFGGRT